MIGSDMFENDAKLAPSTLHPIYPPRVPVGLSLFEFIWGECINLERVNRIYDLALLASSQYDAQHAIRKTKSLKIWHRYKN